MPDEMDFLTRRRFLGALASSAVAAGAPLPIGWPAAEAGSTPAGVVTLGCIFKPAAFFNTFSAELAHALSRQTLLLVYEDCEAPNA